MTIEFHNTAPYRVLVNGAEISRHERYDEAMQVGYAAAAVHLGTLVEVVGGTGIQIVVQAATQPPVDPETEIPEQPTDPDPEEPTEPEEPEQPNPEDPPPVEYQGDHPFFALAAGMEKGEFRRVSRIPGVTITFPPGVADQRAMHQTNWLSGAKDATIGRGWTDRSVFDPLTGRCYEVYCREEYETSIVWLNPDLSWDGIPAPPEAGIGGRRPFDRLCRMGEYLYFFPNIPRDQVGRITRCHVTTPHIWEDAGAPPLPEGIKIGPNFNGDCTLTAVENLGRFVLDISGPGGRGDTSPEGVWDYEYGLLLSWAPGDAQWRLETRTQSSGHVAVATYNPVHGEALVWGGSSAFDRPHPLSGHCLTTYGSEGALRHGPCGLFASAAKRRLGVHPQTGDYILLDRILVDNPQNNHDGPIRIWIGDPTRGRPMRLMHLLPRGDVFSVWEEYHPPVMLWGTDLIVWMDRERGPILHRLYTWEELEGAVEIPIPQRGQLEDPVDDDDDDDPDDLPEAPEEPEAPPVIEVPEPVEPVTDLALTRLVQMGAMLAPGEIMRLDPALPEPWAAFSKRNTFAPDVGLPADMTTWGARGFFDRQRMLALMIGDRTPLGAKAPRLSFHGYDATRHAMDHLDLSSLLEPLADPKRKNEPGKAHPYNQMALDDARGVFYYAPLTSQIRRYLIDRDAWEIISVDPNGAQFGGHSPLIMHEGLGTLLISDQQVNSPARLRGWQDGDSAWRDLGEIGHDGYQASGCYSRVRGDALLIGGNRNPDRVTLIDSLSSFHRLAPPPASVDGIPLSFGVSKRNLSSCPVTGDYLWLDSAQRVLFGFNPDRDEWYIAQSWIGVDGWPGPYEGHLLVPISGTDLSIWYSRHTPRIYRHIPVL